MTLAAATSGPPSPTAFAGVADSYARRPWFETPEMEAHLDSEGADAVSRAFCRELAETGLALIDLGEEGRVLCDRVVEETEPYFAAGNVDRVQDAWRRSSAVRRLAVFPAVTARLRLAYGRRPFAFQTLNFRRGTQQAIHSDAIHFHSEPERFMCGVWIALEDVAPGAGPLEYVAGSHALPVLTMQGAGVNREQPEPADYERIYLPALHGRLRSSGLPVRMAAPKKGQALVWAANLAHGGSAIADPAATRRSLVTHFYFEDCLYYTPMTSDPARGRFSTRLPADVATGGWVWPRREGRRAPVPAHRVIDTVARSLLRRPYVHRLAGPAAPTH